MLLAAWPALAQQAPVWQIGEKDGSAQSMALAPAAYQQFLEKDFGWEDRYYLVGSSAPRTDWPYVLPGPADGWGGSGPTSGIRSHQLNILFGLQQMRAGGQFRFVVDVLDHDAQHPPLLKVTVNGQASTFRLPAAGHGGGLKGDFSQAKPYQVAIPLTSRQLAVGGNHIQLTTLDGSWLVFDDVRLEGPAVLEAQRGRPLFVRQVAAAPYTVDRQGTTAQPLLVDVEHLRGRPTLAVALDGQTILTQFLDTGRYVLEAPMPAVGAPRTSRYQVFANGQLLRQGTVRRGPQPRQTAAAYVDTKIGTAHSRWMIAPGPWMPFSMVKLGPDNQNAGWMAGYDPTMESVGTFSHVHEWTMAGLGTLPVTGPLKLKVGDQRTGTDGYRSAIDKSTEEAPLGYYKVVLKDYGIKAELTSTTRCGFQRYTYPRGPNGRVMVDLKIPAEYGYEILDYEIKQVGDRRLEGYSQQRTANAWSGGVNQDYTLHFVLEFDQPIAKFGSWRNGQELPPGTPARGQNPTDAGAYVEFDTRTNNVVQVRSGLSLVDVAGASNNLKQEVEKPFGWRFDAVRQHHVATWNQLLNRLAVTSDDRREKARFYNAMYRGLCSRNTWSDVDGRWVDATERPQQLTDPDAVALGCDAFWNTFWNLNQYWNLVTPEWSSRWVKSQLAMYDANGWLAKGPAGMEYIPVMVAEHEIPLIVGAYQMGIRDYDAQKAFGAAYKMQTTLPAVVGEGFAGNRDLAQYLRHHYVPADSGRFSNGLEYAYDDWTVGQFAKALGKDREYQQFRDRGSWWKNTMDPATGYARLRRADGSWAPDFDPFKSGANEQYVEGNAWQLTYFVPQDVPGLARLIGPQRFAERLAGGFARSYPWRFNAPNDAYWEYPVVQGNQQSMHFAFLFNWVGQPWLTQQWSRAIVDRYYGYGEANAYLGDEDQGQMSAWFTMAALGLFQTDGGCRVAPIYEIGSPLFSKVVIDLGQRYGRGKSFTIEAKNTSRRNRYVQRATLNGQPLSTFWFPAADLLKGGALVLEMGPRPNPAWGVGAPPAAP
ncbi:GH92 family glycosyl hydrolase [Hymenobacter nivis]|uniref:GH92 family glycosyl hydrolase n=1 Tax=Hymenobacter nivis TaxID=1850093 RepID=UPI00195F6DB8|nr:GH92 family glycosyl hydrolase [Hymenobacter nivis]